MGKPSMTRNFNHQKCCILDRQNLGLNHETRGFDYQNRDCTIRFDDPILEHRKLQLETTKMGMKASYT